MKCIFLSLAFVTSVCFAQTPTDPNIIIITTDGFRWQELYGGADSSLLFNTKFVNDTTALRDLYWHSNAAERRQLLMPFTWRYLARHGQLWGNRHYENHVNVSNPYRFSYPGYHEILTGYADPAVVNNQWKVAPQQNILSFLNAKPAFQNKVGAIASWNMFPFILKRTTDSFYINAGYESFETDSLDQISSMVNRIQENSIHRNHATRSDLLTYTLATEYLERHHPRVLFIGFGETDEFAHEGRYDLYLQQAKQFDHFLEQLWNQIQRDPFYRNKTTMFVTTDHGRGRSPAQWTKHGWRVAGSGETWLMQIGPAVKPSGEIRMKAEIFNEQFAQTIAYLLGETFNAAHPVESKVSLIFSDISALQE